MMRMEMSISFIKDFFKQAYIRDPHLSSAASLQQQVGGCLITLQSDTSRSLCFHRLRLFTVNDVFLSGSQTETENS